MKNFLDSKEQRVRNLIVSLRYINGEFEKLKNSFKTSLLEEKFFSEAELSEFLKIERRTLSRYRTTGKIPYYKLEGRVLYRESDIRTLLEDNYHPAYALE